MSNESLAVLFLNWNVKVQYMYHLKIATNSLLILSVVSISKYLVVYRKKKVVEWSDLLYIHFPACKNRPMLKIMKAHIVLLKLNYPCSQHLRSTSNYESPLSLILLSSKPLWLHLHIPYKLNLTINQILIQLANIKITDKRYLAKHICFEQEVNIVD